MLWFYWCKQGCRAHQPLWLLLSSFCSFAPFICSHFWDEQVNIMLLHLVPVNIFCAARACQKHGLCVPATGDRSEENGNIVQPEAGGGRNAGLAAGAGGYQFVGADQSIPHWNLPPKFPPRVRRIPLCQVTCPGLLVLSQLGLEYLRDKGLFQLGEEGSGVEGSPSSAPQPLTDSRELPPAFTGIITKGSSEQHDYYVTSYHVSSSRDRKNWRPYRGSSGQEDKVGMWRISLSRLRPPASGYLATGTSSPSPVGV